MFKKAAFFATLLFGFSLSPRLHAQALPAARTGSHLTVGGMFSVFSPDYGSNQLMGLGVYTDFNVSHHWGAEGEVRFLRLNQLYDVHEDNYLIGPRYRFHIWRVDPYVKIMFGNGQFNFPFSVAHGGYAMWAPGGGVDLRLNRRFTARADYEYQHWNGFQDSSLTPHGVSFGLAYQIF